MTENSQHLTVVIVSGDKEIRAAMAEALQSCYLETILVDGVSELKAIPSEEMIVACLCGFWMSDGTTREVSAYLKSQPIEIPLIMVSEPEPTREYEDFLDSLSLGAFDFVCYPYHVDAIQLIVWSAIQSYCELADAQISRTKQRNGLYWFQDSPANSLQKSA